jgi:molecular chaperone DnaK
MTTVVDRKTPIPVRRTALFGTTQDDHSTIPVVVLQGERERASDNRFLGRFRLDNIRPGGAGRALIQVTFDIDVDGTLEVSARDMETGAEGGLPHAVSVHVDRLEVDRRIADARRHRHDDGELRRLVELRYQFDALAHELDRQLCVLRRVVSVRVG